MNVVDKVKWYIENSRENELTPAEIAIAYLEIHQQNPALHPDDYLGEGGYIGWQVITIYLRERKVPSPDSLVYPCFLGQMEGTLDILRTLHDGDDVFLSKVVMLEQWLDDMNTETLLQTIGFLQDFTTFHADHLDDLPGLREMEEALWAIQAAGKRREIKTTYIGKE